MAEPEQAPPPPEPMRVQVLEKMSELMTAAFGLVAALAWNEAIKGLIDYYYGPGGGLKAKFTYAFLITVIVVLLALWIARAISRMKRVVARPIFRRKKAST
jgi:hypothetical protein